MHVQTHAALAYTQVLSFTDTPIFRYKNDQFLTNLHPSENCMFSSVVNSCYVSLIRVDFMRLNCLSLWYFILFFFQQNGGAQACLISLSLPAVVESGL